MFGTFRNHLWGVFNVGRDEMIPKLEINLYTFGFLREKNWEIIEQLEFLN